MKQFVCMVCLIGAFITSFAQPSSIQIATDKTISLIFPYPIRHVDRGTRDVLVQPVEEAGNILLVKAASKDFPQTNLSIVTDDGSVYSIAVVYGESSTWVYRFPVQMKASIYTYANSILDNPVTMIGIRNASWDMIAKVIGIYIKDEVIYYQLSLRNKSPIDYDFNFLRFYLRDKKKAKRTAVQEAEIIPLYVVGNTSAIKANTRSSIVVALNKFTIPDAKYLAIEIGEKNGGRNLLMKVSNRKLIKAVSLPDLK